MRDLCRSDPHVRAQPFSIGPTDSGRLVQRDTVLDSAFAGMTLRRSLLQTRRVALTPRQGSRNSRLFQQDFLSGLM